jgi:hypothetical protein
MDYRLVKETLSKKTSEDLLTILEYSQDDYTPEAVMILKVILLDRGIPLDKVEETEKRFKHLKENIPSTNSQSRTTFPVKSILWIVSILSLSMVIYLKDQIIPASLNYVLDNSKKQPIQHFQWSDSLKTAINNNLMKGALVSGMQPKYKQPFCDCFIRNIVNRYPNGVADSVPHLVKDTIVGDCAEYVKTDVR